MPFVAAALLFAVFLGLLAAMSWQEATRRRRIEAPVYGVEDAVQFTSERIDPAHDLGRADVRRILEWEVFYLQGLADRKATDLEVVAGGAPAAIEYIVAENARTGHDYSYEQVEAVLHLEAHYLASIGAIGEAIGEVDR